MARTNQTGQKIAFAGAQTISSIAEAHSRLCAMRDGQKSFQIDCSGVTEVDLSFVQLLLAARTSARNDGGRITLSQPASGALRDALLRGGFLTADGSHGADDGFWQASGAS
jgi:anti-anti-sigma regulatory factor